MHGLAINTFIALLAVARNAYAEVIMNQVIYSSVISYYTDVVAVGCVLAALGTERGKS